VDELLTKLDEYVGFADLVRFCYRKLFANAQLSTLSADNISLCIARTDILIFSSFQEWANTMARRPSSVCLSVRPSVNFCANIFFSQTNGRITTKLSQDGLQVSVHPGCAQGQGQRSRDLRTFLDSWNELLRHWQSGFLSVSWYFVAFTDLISY